MKKSLKLCVVFCLLGLFACSSSAKKPDGPVKIAISTSLGDIEVELYSQTPKHRDNFVNLVKNGYFDGVLFHRVIKDFMIQAGDPDSKNAKPGARLGSGGPDYTIPAEFVPELIHRRGALSAARQGDNVNPEKASSGSQFYIVQGKVYTDEELNQIENQVTMGKAQQLFMQYIREEDEAAKAAGKTETQQAIQEKAKTRAMEWVQNNPYKMPEERRAVYKTEGGTPHLDDAYTVFGQVTKGLEIVEKISLVATDAADRPAEDVKIIKMKII
ncbi:MAG: peptidylprolyl isomerase [Bacteroidales bacterium]|jgi:peptidylprolyl isomerase|nr:peptidylprolyl isomerase [Bacteroidales bacterium]